MDMGVMCIFYFYFLGDEMGDQPQTQKLNSRNRTSSMNL